MPFLPGHRAAAIANGEAFYFTGKPCKHGHLAKRYVKNGGCIVCLEKRAQCWEAENRERRRSLQRAFNKANPEKRRERERRYRLKHIEKYRERQRSRKRDPDLTLANSRRWRERHPEIYKTKVAIWTRENPEAARAIRQTRRARKKNAEGQFNADDIKRILKQQRGRCAFYIDCGTKFSRNGFHVDHIEALANGGSNWPRNLQLLCPNCNSRKHKLDPISYANRQGRLV